MKKSDMSSHMPLQGSLSVDEREDMLNALEHAVEVTSTLDVTPLNWKWLLISIHNALQGALVCTLSGSDGTGALGDKSAKAVWNVRDVALNSKLLRKTGLLLQWNYMIGQNVRVS